MIGFLKKLFSGREPVARRAIRARYDAAQTTDNNRRWWANADGLSAGAANSAHVRKVLRERSRYEVANNSYAEGMVDTRANDIVGTGPRLLLRNDPGGVRAAWDAWATEIDLAQVLRTACRAWDTDGEAVFLLRRDPNLVGPVKLCVELVECDRLSSLTDPYAQPSGQVDGIDFDEYGRPSRYWILPQHPGDLLVPWRNAPVPFDAGEVLHLFSKNRPEQKRGVPRLTPALPLFAMLRDYTLATLDAAKAAAYFAAVLESEYQPDVEDAPSPMDTLDLERGLMTTLPFGTKLNQVDAKQPVDTYASFKHEVLAEIARCLHMPFNIAGGNSASYNYASGRLDHQTYYRSIGVSRDQLRSVVLDPLLRLWLLEASLSPALDGADDAIPPSHKWMWDGAAHVDPLKEANAAAIRLETGQDTYADFYAAEGEDWVEQFRQRAAEAELAKSLGLQLPGLVMPQQTAVARAAGTAPLMQEQA